MSVLDEVLEEEYSRLVRMKDRMQAEYLELPKGYISRKKIYGYECYYLQYRDGSKIVSHYIKPDEFEDLQAAIIKRKSLKESLKNIDIEMKKIERAMK
jgi:hypothetical protein